MGVLSILSIVTVGQADGNVVKRVRQTTTGLHLVSQWLLPTTIRVVSATHIAIVGMFSMLWELCLVVSMLIMIHQIWTVDSWSGSTGVVTVPSTDKNRVPIAVFAPTALPHHSHETRESLLDVRATFYIRSQSWVMIVKTNDSYSFWKAEKQTIHLSV